MPVVAGVHSNHSLIAFMTKKATNFARYMVMVNMKTLTFLRKLATYRTQPHLLGQHLVIIFSLKTILIPKIISQGLVPSNVLGDASLIGSLFGNISIPIGSPVGPHPLAVVLVLILGVLIRHSHIIQGAI